MSARYDEIIRCFFYLKKTHTKELTLAPLLATKKSTDDRQKHTK
jgi:hypothetical protein